MKQIMIGLLILVTSGSAIKLKSQIQPFFLAGYGSSRFLLHYDDHRQMHNDLRPLVNVGGGISKPLSTHLHWRTQFGMNWTNLTITFLYNRLGGVESNLSISSATLATGINLQQKKDRGFQGELLMGISAPILIQGNLTITNYNRIPYMETWSNGFETIFKSFNYGPTGSFGYCFNIKDKLSFCPRLTASIGLRRIWKRDIDDILLNPRPFPLGVEFVFSFPKKSTATHLNE
jgi:hypothetical protein